MDAYLIICVLTLICFWYFSFHKKKYDYWKSRGINGPPPVPVLGNYMSVMLNKESTDDFLKKVYHQYPEEQVVGLYRGFEPVLLIRDPDLIKQIMIKDFAFFQYRGFSVNVHEMVNKNLFMLDGEPWRILRHKLSPVFSSGKLKNMVPLVQNCVDKYIKYISEQIEDNTPDQETRSLSAKYTIEVIGSCAFGMNLSSLSNNLTEFEIVAKNFLQIPLKLRIWNALDMIIPGIRNYFSELSKTNQDLDKFFKIFVANIIRNRQENATDRKYFVDFIIHLKEQGKLTRREESGKIELEMSDELVAAQAFGFYLASYETSSTTMAFLIYELAHNPKVQDKVYKEVCNVYDKYNGNIPYEGLQELTYLDMTLDTTLRKYPVLGSLLRRVSVNYKFPGTTISIEEGTSVFVSVSGLQSDEKYFPDPEAFDPEVFSPEKRRNIPHYVYLPFGTGPRNCMGMRFAKVQLLMGMAAFFKHFKVESSDKTKSLVPDPSALSLIPLNGIWVKICER